MNDISGVWIPIIAMLIPITAIVGGIVSQMHRSRLKAEQRMQLIARGVPLAEIDAYMKPDADGHREERPVKDPVRSLGNARRAAVVLVSTGLGLTIFMLILGTVLLVNINHTAGLGRHRQLSCGTYSSGDRDRILGSTTPCKSARCRASGWRLSEDGHGAMSQPPVSLVPCSRMSRARAIIFLNSVA